jgi:hypothetical protein
LAQAVHTIGRILKDAIVSKQVYRKISAQKVSPPAVGTLDEIDGKAPSHFFGSQARCFATAINIDISFIVVWLSKWSQLCIVAKEGRQFVGSNSAGGSRKAGNHGHSHGISKPYSSIERYRISIIIAVTIIIIIVASEFYFVRS